MKRSLELLLLFLFFGSALTLGVLRIRAVRIGSVIPPEIVSFKATPRVISRGEPVTLKWETRGADAVVTEWGPEYRPLGIMQRRTGLPPSGAITVSPEEDTVYILECKTDSGQVRAASATVRVRP